MKNRFDLLPKLVSVALFFSLIACAAMSAVAQEVVYDWDKQQLTSPTLTINRTRSVTIVVENVNDILFDYQINVMESARPIDDWAKFGNSVTRVGRTAVQTTGPEASTVNCVALIATAKKLLNDINDAISKDPALPIAYKDIRPYRSVPLKDSRDAWAKVQGKITELRATVREIEQDCATQGAEFLKAYREANDYLSALERKVYSNHEKSLRTTFRPEYDYTLTIKEIFWEDGTPQTVKQSDPITIKPISNQLTLTTGVLFSRIQDRGYEQRKFPGMDQTVLSVEGNSRLRPEGVALLNYLLPLDNDTTGLALSAGPVIRFGSQSDIATLGFFTGLSGHLYRRFYVTPGFHIGEFADFPVGFREGQSIPANFGPLEPVKRWTARFAFGISFRTASFGSSQTSKVTEGETGKAKGKGNGNGGGDDDSDSNHYSRSPEPVAASDRERNATARRAISSRDASAQPIDSTPFMRTASLRSTETRTGSRVTIVADGMLRDYTSFTNGNVFYMVIPNAIAVRGQEALNGRDFGAARIEQSGKNLVISFTVPRGMTARVSEKFNCLEVSFAATEVDAPVWGMLPAPAIRK